MIDNYSVCSGGEKTQKISNERGFSCLLLPPYFHWTSNCICLCNVSYTRPAYEVCRNNFVGNKWSCIDPHLCAFMKISVLITEVIFCSGICLQEVTGSRSKLCERQIERKKYNNLPVPAQKHLGRYDRSLFFLDLGQRMAMLHFIAKPVQIYVELPKHFKWPIH